MKARKLPEFDYLENQDLNLVVLKEMNKLILVMLDIDFDLMEFEHDRPMQNAIIRKIKK